MKNLLIDKKRKFLRKIYGALSLSTAIFIFQACYGTSEDMLTDVYIQGFVKSKTTNLPISGIKVMLMNEPHYEYTDSSGKFGIYATIADEYILLFEDVDSKENGTYFPKDTTLKVIDENSFLTITLISK